MGPQGALRRGPFFGQHAAWGHGYATRYLSRVCAGRLVGQFACGTLFRASRLLHYVRAYIDLRVLGGDAHNAWRTLRHRTRRAWDFHCCRLSSRQVRDDKYRSKHDSARGATAAALSPLGIAAILVLAGVGILIFHSGRLGVMVLIVLTTLLAVMHVVPWSPSVSMSPSAQASASTYPAGLTDMGTFFFEVGALAFGGGLTMIAFIQEQVVNQFHWLTQQEFIDGLALSQFTPGPILMVAAYIGYKLAGVAGAVVAATATFLPSFILVLSMLPMFERVRTLVWIKAAMKGVGPAVMGVLAVSLVWMAPHALPDPFAIAILMGTLMALLAWHIGAIKLMLAGAVLGVLRSRLTSLPNVRVTLFL